MRKLNILNKKQIKKILDLIKQQWGCTVKLDYTFLQSQKDKLYIVSKDISKIDFSKIRVDSVGIYFGVMQHNELRLSLEGSQLIGPYAKKNVLELDEKQAKQWMKGQDIDYPGSTKAFLIIKHNKYYLGCAKHKNDKLFNHVPKARRLLY